MRRKKDIFICGWKQVFNPDKKYIILSGETLIFRLGLVSHIIFLSMVFVIFVYFFLYIILDFGLFLILAGFIENYFLNYELPKGFEYDEDGYDYFNYL